MSMNDRSKPYDYIIVGAGSAGCALAYRLSREASRKVLLLEAGPQDNNPIIHMPLGFAFLLKDKKVNWCYQTDPEPNMDNRNIDWPRGKVLGGSSSINGMVYIRGNKADYDDWASQGNKGWSYEEVMPYFLRSEHKAEGPSEYHGYGGPLWVENVKNEEKLELAELFLQAAVQTGMPYNEDFNGATQDGAGYYQLNIKNGARQSSAKTFLKLCEKRPNLTIKTQALSHRILIENGVAVGVEYEQTTRKGKTRVTAYAKSEVILCAGVINSPQLLELSGIGSKEVLEPLDITVEKELSGVGENLQDHLTINITQGLHGVKTFYEETRPVALVRNLLKYLFSRRGLIAHPAAQAGLFFRTDEAQDRPMAQVHFAPAASESDAKGNLKTAPGTTATVCQLRPESRGSVHITSKNPQTYPSIKANYLSTQGDRDTMVAAVRRVRDVFKAPALDKYRGQEFNPGAQAQSDEEILDYVRAEAASVYHPVGTCKMGNDNMAVVDDRLRVHGIEALRVADASIMPTLITGNTNATAVMIAEKCADMILQDAKQRNT
jgi:choline dehydrogenase